MSFIDKRLIKQIYGNSNDFETKKYHLINLMRNVGFECKDWWDYVVFNRVFPEWRTNEPTEEDFYLKSEEINKIYKELYEKIGKC